MELIDKKIQKLTYIVNAMIALCVVGFAFIFKYAKADNIAYISMAVLVYYALANLLIWKKQFQAYVASLYLVITFYMFAATVNVGLNSGFQMYCLSMIPLLFYFNYLGEQLKQPKSHPLLFSVFIAVTYFGCTSYVLVSGAIYEIDKKIQAILLATNSLWVIMLLIFYSSLMVKMIREYEDRLKKNAVVDKLTGLYNRHFMIEQLDKIDSEDAHNHWVAIIDIDNFKSVNDIYGHNAGDEVLKGVANIISSVCSECTYARWGGEEFLISASYDKNRSELLEKLRCKVCEKPFVYEDKEIAVTITIGSSICTDNESMDKWIKRADNLLYEGKNAGKNRVMGI